MSIREFLTRRRLFAIPLLAAAVIFSGTANANLIVNGDFETGDFTNFWTDAFTGWTTTNVGVPGSDPEINTYMCCGPAFPSGHLSDSAAYFGNTTATKQAVIAQSIAPANGIYHIEFWFQSAQGVQPNDLLVQFDGQTVFNLHDIVVPTYPDWQLYATDVMVSDSPATLSLSFTGWNQGDYLLIDDVSVTVPEPAGVALLGMGLLALAFNRRKRTG